MKFEIKDKARAWLKARGGKVTIHPPVRGGG